MRVHLIEGEAGCACAVAHEAVAIVVDALRASSTAAMLFDAGAKELLVVRRVEDAFAAKPGWPDALLYGERGGLPPAGFDYGNSPLDARAAAGRRVIFTTTTGSQRLIACWGAAQAYMGAIVNAQAVAQAATGHGKDVVVIPAGLFDDPAFDAQEDWTAAVEIAQRTGLPVGEGAQAFEAWRARIDAQGIPALFDSSPHAEKLRRVGLKADIAFCARADLTRATPRVKALHVHGVIVGP